MVNSKGTCAPFYCCADNFPPFRIGSPGAVWALKFGYISPLFFRKNGFFPFSPKNCLGEPRRTRAPQKSTKTARGNIVPETGERQLSTQIFFAAVLTGALYEKRPLLGGGPCGRQQPFGGCMCSHPCGGGGSCGCRPKIRGPAILGGIILCFSPYYTSSLGGPRR